MINFANISKCTTKYTFNQHYMSKFMLVTITKTEQDSSDLKAQFRNQFNHLC